MREYKENEINIKIRIIDYEISTLKRKLITLEGTKAKIIEEYLRKENKENGN